MNPFVSVVIVNFNGARWLGKEQKPYGNDASFVQECLACHDQVKDNDSVFTHPLPLP